MKSEGKHQASDGIKMKQNDICLLAFVAHHYYDDLKCVPLLACFAFVPSAEEEGWTEGQKGEVEKQVAIPCP